MIGLVETVRSDHFNIGRFATKLPGFVAAQPGIDEFAHALCILETALAQLTDPLETESLTPEHLTGMTQDELMEAVLYPREALQLFAFEWALNDYYCAVKEERPAPMPERRPTYLAVFRHEDMVWRMDLEAQEYALLQRLFSGMQVGMALEELQANDNDIAGQLSHWFARWMRNGLLAYLPDRQPQKLAS